MTSKFTQVCNRICWRIMDGVLCGSRILLVVAGVITLVCAIAVIDVILAYC